MARAITAAVPRDCTRTTFVALALLLAPSLAGCEVAVRLLSTNAFWASVDNVGRAIGSTSNDPFASSTPRGPVVDSLAEDARFVASRLVTCPLDETRIVRRTRHRFTAVGCGREIVLRCRAPRDGSPTRCREVHPAPEPLVAESAPSAGPESREP